METSKVIISITLIIICVLPFLIINGKAKKRAQLIKSTLETKIQKDNKILGDYEVHNSFAIGIDSNNSLIYFYIKKSEMEQFKKIKLTQISTCQVVKVTKRITNGKSNYELIERVKLVFYNSKNSEEEQFELYNDEDNSQLDGEIALAHSWKQKLDEILHTSDTRPTTMTTLESNNIFV
ncbi:hypothetical protein IL45_01305 [Nonlabens ulvanivorans]|uniref:Uncharacterized protein n=2 Tax=Nonlabens ulvanivorans TaxID=906888 RepID=A0A084K016_NONUL|nr:hypothetical protein IL45_01305 [Nonlabens ulvanivorans]PRX13413.1 hypothetical protein LY02_01655 [Nonlabens ulvanivorans]